MTIGPIFFAAPWALAALAALPADPGRRHLRQPAKEWVRRRTDALRLALGTTLKMAIAATRRRRVAALVAALVAAGLVLNGPCVLLVPFRAPCRAPLPALLCLSLESHLLTS